MSNGDDTKTKEQLIAELDALRTAGRDGAKADEPAEEEPAPALPSITRRSALLSWVAPVILSLGTAVKPSTAYAADDFVAPPLPTTRAPTTAAPTTPAPTLRRIPTTRAPTAAPPTLAPPTLAPTAAPTTRAPTRTGRCIPAPTVSPTLGLASAPDCGQSLAHLTLGSARALWAEQLAQRAQMAA